MKWEYVTVDLEHNFEEDVELEKLGDDGWELVTVVPWKTSELKTFYFKRPINWNEQ